MSNTKPENYTKAQTSEMVTAYQAGETDSGRKAVVSALAQEMKKSPASIRAKLVSEGVYIKAERLTKSGAKVEQKSAIVEDIAALMGVPSELVDSLDKANKSVLQLVRTNLTPTEEIDFPVFVEAVAQD